MDRRAFFTKSAGKVAHAVTKHAAEKARQNATRWIRPPFAIDELDFLIACSRCGDCISACQYGVIFPLSSKLGVKVFNTPALDLHSQGCHLCDSWPCVQACDKAALKIPDIADSTDQVNAAETSSLYKTSPDIKLSTEALSEEESIEVKQNNQPQQKPLPKISKVSINIKTCLPYSGPECGACRVCPVEGAMIWDMEKPSINNELCTGCALCREACIIEPKAILVQSIYKSDVA